MMRFNLCEEIQEFTCMEGDQGPKALLQCIKKRSPDRLQISSTMRNLGDKPPDPKDEGALRVFYVRRHQRQHGDCVHLVQAWQPYNIINKLRVCMEKNSSIRTSKLSVSYHKVRSYMNDGEKSAAATRPITMTGLRG